MTRIEGYHLPSFKNTQVRFLKEFLQGSKLLIKSAEVMHFNVPRYMELSTANLLDMVKEDEEVMKHLNYYDGKQRTIERGFFLGVIGTLHPNYLCELIKAQNRVRNNPSQEENKEEMIKVVDDIWAKILSEPFFTSKISYTDNALKSHAAEPQS